MCVVDVVLMLCLCSVDLLRVVWCLAILCVVDV